MTAYAAPRPPTDLSATTASADQINLAWTDNSANETGFKIERAPNSGGVPGTWTQIAAVGQNITTYNDTGVSADTKYWYRVRSYNNGGNSGYSNAASALTPPLPPSNLMATAVSTDQINLSWTDNANTEAGFAIERLDNGSSGTWAQVATVGANVTTYSDTNLFAATTYSYRLRAYNAAGNSLYCAAADATTLCDPVTIAAQPVSQTVCSDSTAQFTVTATGSGLNYQWRRDGFNLTEDSNFSGVHSSTLTISNSASGVSVCGTVWGTNGAGKVIGNVLAGRTYSYEASGCLAYAPNMWTDPDGTRSLNVCSTFYNGTIYSTTPPLTCPGLTNWSLVGKIGDACLQLGKSGSFVAPASGPLTLYCNDQVGLFYDNGGSWNVCVAVGPEGTYDVLVTGSCGSQVSSGAVLTINSNPGCMSLGVTSPAEYAYTTNSSVGITGTASARAGVGGVTVNLVSATSVDAFTNWSATVSGLVAGTNTLTVIATDNAVPANTITNTCHVLYASGTFDGNGDGLPDAWQIQYFGSVSAPDAAPTADPDGDGVSNLQEYLDGTDPTHPAPLGPSGLVATAVSISEIDLSWTDNADNEDGFRIERAPDSGGSPGAWTQIAAVPINTTRYNNTGLLSATTYWYRLRAFNANGVSRSSNQASAQTLCETVTIVIQPVSQTVCSGETAQFSVTATGSGLNYQWRKNGFNLTDDGAVSGANSPTLTISNAVFGGGVCDTVSGTDNAGRTFGSVVAGQVYDYQASGCLSFSSGQWDDPDGNLSTDSCSTFSPGVVSGGTPAFMCPGLTNWSLVGNVNGVCIQLGEHGSFVAPASGPLTLYCNDQNGLFWDNGGSWNVCVNSGAEGLYDVVVTGVCGSQISSSAVLTVNSNPGCLTLSVTSPADYTYTTNSSISLTGTASASAGVAGVTVNLVSATSVDAFTNWSATVSGLVAGTNTLTVIAADNAVPANTLTNTWHVLYASGPFDGNGDGLPDAWQIQYFGSVSSPDAASNADPDGDGVSNLQEFLEGTDPTAPAPAAPSAFTAMAVSTSQIDLFWIDNANNEDGFKIERATDSGNGAGAWAQLALVSANVTTYSDTGALPNTVYWYRVRAYNANGGSQFSNPANAMIAIPPAAPSNLTAVPGKQINLSWTDNADNEDGFRIDRAPDNGGSPGAWTQIAIVGASVVNYSDTGLLPNTTYWYRVRAYNAGGSSDYSNPASATAPSLASPSGLSASVISTNQINLTWTDNSSDEYGFEIERAVDSGGSPGAWTQIVIVSANTTLYNDLEPAAGTKYRYRVRAYKGEQASDYSNQASAATPALCPRLVVGWGENGSGQATPPAGLAWVTALAAGAQHSLALKIDGTVTNWGNPLYGAPPAGLSNVIAIAAGDYHSLALKSDGTVVGWGQNTYGQTNTPAGLSNVVAIAAGNYFSLALKSDGTVTNWGDPYYGRVFANVSNAVAISARAYNGQALLNNGSVTGYGQIKPPSGLTNLVAIAAGVSHCLGLRSDGTVVGWGYAPTQPVGLSNVVAIAAGNGFSLALKSDGTLVGWGSGTAATPPTGLAPATAIAAGYYHGLALTTPCSLSAPSALTATAASPSQINLSWLDNSGDESGFRIERATSENGPWTQIARVLRNTTSYRDTGLWPGTTYYYRVRPYNSGGDGDPSNEASASTPALCPTSLVAWGNGPPPPSGLTGVVAIASGLNRSLMLKSDGTVVRWGGSAPPAGLAGVVAIATGGNHGLALLSDGTVVDWGYPPTATPPAGLSNVVAISAGYGHSLALKYDSTIVGWGDNTYGQTNIPSGLSGVVAIAAGDYHNVALKSDGTVVVWGRNNYGQTNTPAGLTRVVGIAAGGYHNLALKSNGTVIGWGNNLYGQANVSSGLTGVVAISAGHYHSLALKSNGTVVAWGDNSYGQTNVPVGLSGVVAIAAGHYHNLVMSCAPSAPSALGATAVAANQINLVWTDNSNSEDRFGIERAITYLGPWAEIGSVDANATTYADMGVGCGHSYFYRVRAYNALGGSLYSGVAYTDTSGADSDGDGMTDCWTLQYFGHPTGQESDHSRATDDADGDGLTNLQEFQAGSNPTVPAPAAPAGLTATAVATNQIDLLWTDNASTEDGFKIERAPDAGGNPGIWMQIATVSSNVTAYSDAGLPPNRTYWYRVVAYNAGGELGSNEAQATTPCAPFDPTVITTQPSSQEVCAGETATLSVEAVGSSLTYQWRRNGMDLTDGGGISGANAATLVISNALPGEDAVCDTVVGTDEAGKAFGTIVAGQTYDYQATGCVMYAYGSYVAPDGLLSTNNCSTLNIPGVAGSTSPPLICPGLTNWSLVGKVDDSCIQLGRSGRFVAPASGTLTLYCNDQTGLLGDNGGSWDVCVGQGSEGVYDVVVTGVCGSQVSSGAVLTVHSPPGCMTLSVTWPPDYGYTTNSTVQFIGTASANDGVAGVAVNLLDAASSDGFTNWAANVSDLAIGTNTLMVIATDKSVPANTLTNTWHVIYAAGAFDGNGDSLPDAWQIRFFGSVNSLNAAPAADPDGDGFTNLQEFQAGTDPTNNASAFRIIDIWPEDDDMFITWTAMGGKRYALQTTTNSSSLFLDDFTDLNPAIVVRGTDETTVSVLHLGAATNAPVRFYRVRLVP